MVWHEAVVKPAEVLVGTAGKRNERRRSKTLLTRMCTPWKNQDHLLLLNQQAMKRKALQAKYCMEAKSSSPQLYNVRRRLHA